MKGGFYMDLKIKELRKQAGLTQVELAKIVGVSVRTIQSYEANAITPPVDKLKRIAEALRLSINDFMTYEEQRNEETLKSIQILMEKHPEFKPDILNIIHNVCEVITLEFLKPASTPSTELLTKIRDANILLYENLFTELLGFSTTGLGIFSNNDSLEVFQSKGQEKIKKITNLLNQLLLNYSIRNNFTDDKIQESDKNK